MMYLWVARNGQVCHEGQLEAGKLSSGWAGQAAPRGGRHQTVPAHDGDQSNLVWRTSRIDDGGDVLKVLWPDVWGQGD